MTRATNVSYTWRYARRTGESTVHMYICLQAKTVFEMILLASRCSDVSLMNHSATVTNRSCNPLRPHFRQTRQPKCQYLGASTTVSLPPVQYYSVKLPICTVSSLPYKCVRASDSRYRASQDYRRLMKVESTAGWGRQTSSNVSLRHLSTANNSATKPFWQKHRAIQSTAIIEVSTKELKQLAVKSVEQGLSDEQLAVLDLVLNKRQNVFFTGPAGTGKSFLLKKIIEGLIIRYLEGSDDCVAVTASTGLAAFTISGKTLHSFAGIGLGTAPTKQLIKDILSNKSSCKRWRYVEVLIIDEVSMVDNTLFDKLDVIGRAVRECDLPFGGIQLVITGDFFQLPPVVQRSDDGSPRFCFEAKAWKDAVRHTISLTKVYRQKDPLFSGMLNEMREGRVSTSTISTFRRLSRPVTKLADKGLEAVQLFPLRREADFANNTRLQKLDGKVYEYTSEDGGIVTNPSTRKKLLSNCPAPKMIQLKRGAQVMLVKNLGRGLVNGSQGCVIGFANEENFFHAPWHDKYYVTREDWDPEARLTMGKEALPGENLPLYPVVRFHGPGDSTQVEHCVPQRWVIERWVRIQAKKGEDNDEEDRWFCQELATRTQVPLILAWALSIHKAQGQTLSLVKVDLGNVFEKGQAYVALSRATSIDGLQVLNFNPYKVQAHPKVKAFYASLSRL